MKTQTTDGDEDTWRKRIKALERMARECAELRMPAIRDFLRARAQEIAQENHRFKSKFGSEFCDVCNRSVLEHQRR